MNKGLAEVLVILAGLTVSTAIAWRRRNPAVLPNWRMRISHVALACNLAALIAYIIEIAWFRLVVRGGPPFFSSAYEVFTSGEPILFFLLISIVAVLGGAFGRGVTRVLTSINGAVLFILWWMLALGTTV